MNPLVRGVAALLAVIGVGVALMPDDEKETKVESAGKTPKKKKEPPEESNDD